MRVTRIGWAGTRTDGYRGMVDFLTSVLGLTLTHAGWRHLRAPDGNVYELSTG